MEDILKIESQSLITYCINNIKIWTSKENELSIFLK